MTTCPQPSRLPGIELPDPEALTGPQLNGWDCALCRRRLHADQLLGTVGWTCGGVTEEEVDLYTAHNVSSESARTSAISSSRTDSSLKTRRERRRSPRSSATTQWWCSLPMSTPAQIWGTVTSASSSSHTDPADDLADVVLHSDRVAYPNERSSRRGTPGGQVL